MAWADRLRNWATFLVVAIHVSAPVAQENTAYNSSAWWAGNIWDSLGRPAVPLFVMLSGYLLLGKDYALSYFLQRRFARVVIPSLFWMLVYSYYNHVANGAPATWADAIRGLISGPVHYHLWFVYLIVGLYITYPVLVPWVRTAGKQDYAYFFVVCMVGTWVYKVLVWFFDVEIGVYFEFFTNQAGYFVLGYYLGHVSATSVADKKQAAATLVANDALSATEVACKASLATKAACKTSSATKVADTVRRAWLLIVFGTALTAIGTWWASRTYGNVFHGFFYDYLTPGVTISAIGWFLLARHAWDGRRLTAFEEALSSASFGMYFVHVLVMDWWSEAGYWQTKGHPALWIPVVTIMVYTMSFVFVALLRTMGWGRRVT